MRTAQDQHAGDWGTGAQPRAGLSASPRLAPAAGASAPGPIRSGARRAVLRAHSPLSAKLISGGQDAAATIAGSLEGRGRGGGGPEWGLKRLGQRWNMASEPRSRDRFLQLPDGGITVPPGPTPFFR